MKNLNKNYIFITISLLWLLGGCTTFNTTLDTSKPINKDKVKNGKSCAKYIFGSIKISYIGNIGIKFAGTESATQALLNGGITKPFGVDTRNKNYFFYSKKCTIVYGE